MNVYLLKEYTISTVSIDETQKNVQCFYILSNQDNFKKNKKLPYYKKLHNIILNRSLLADF
jgi:hypothetical protein